MQFGITLKPDISIERIVGLTRRAEKAGFEYGRAFNRNEYAANGNYVLRYFDGAPLEVQTYNTPITGDNQINTISIYGQDSWVANRRPPEPRLRNIRGGRGGGERVTARPRQRAVAAPPPLLQRF